jgi:hypothetical protein
MMSSLSPLVVIQHADLVASGDGHVSRRTSGCAVHGAAARVALHASHDLDAVPHVRHYFVVFVMFEDQPFQRRRDGCDSFGKGRKAAQLDETVYQDGMVASSICIIFSRSQRLASPS